MKSYESPKTYTIWESPIGCIHEDITEYGQAFIKRAKELK